MTIAGFDGREKETERRGIESKRRKPVVTNVSLTFYSVKSPVRLLNDVANFRPLIYFKSISALNWTLSFSNEMERIQIPFKCA